MNQTRDTTYPSFGSNESEDVNKNAFSWQAGALYLFDNGIAPFVSYATSFDPVTNRSTSGKILEPTEGEQYELGVKYQRQGQISCCRRSPIISSNRTSQCWSIR